MNCLIAIPIYKVSPSQEEIASLHQGINVLNSHKICLFHPEGLNLNVYQNICGDNCEFVAFSKENFLNEHTYSNLLLSSEFYKKFTSYDYMLIYQLDAWVFSDKLQEWMKQGFDYIGAPWFTGFHTANDLSNILPKCGNGGLSLRNISNMLKTIKIYENFSLNLSNNLSSLMQTDCIPCKMSSVETLFQDIDTFYKLTCEMISRNEDWIISKYFDQLNHSFRIASGKEAIAFSFESQPERLYEMNNRQLPFGCHAFKRYNWDFWKDFIKL